MKTKKEKTMKIRILIEKILVLLGLIYCVKKAQMKEKLIHLFMSETITKVLEKTVEILKWRGITVVNINKKILEHAAGGI